MTQALKMPVLVPEVAQRPKALRLLAPEPARVPRTAEDLDADMQRFFEKETTKLKTEYDALPNKDGLAGKLLRDEIDLRRRRLAQWKENPSGVPGNPFAEFTDYSRT